RVCSLRGLCPRGTATEPGPQRQNIQSHLDLRGRTFRVCLLLPEYELVEEFFRGV
ncbi:hypothetical protein A2U01_0065807, partial [Trifolium medium]|nr:hypothetical protein [Trifolium medium]